MLKAEKTMNRMILKLKNVSQKEGLDRLNIIAIVGKMASGKNFVSSAFEKLGWQSIDADCLVHQAIDQAEEIIVKTFEPYAKKCGISLLNQQKKIDRRALGSLLFSNPDLLKKQEEIVYPIICKMTDNFIEEHDKIIINATVLYKTPELLKRCQKIIYVKSSFLTRFFRAKKRDKLPLKQIISRFLNQKNLYFEYKKSKIPLIVIKN